MSDYQNNKPVQQTQNEEMKAWLHFTHSGTIYDYIQYRNLVHTEGTTQNVNQNRRIGSQTTEYR